MNLYDSITFNIGKVSRYIRDTNKNCFDNIISLYNKTSDNISKGYNNDIIIKENTYINEDCLKESLIIKDNNNLRKSLAEITINQS